MTGLQRFAMRRGAPFHGLLAAMLICMLALAPVLVHVGAEPDQGHMAYAQSQTQGFEAIGCDEGVACNSALVPVTVRVLLHTVIAESWTPHLQSTLVRFPTPGIVLPPPRLAV